MVTKICRVCGKEYPACRNARRSPSGVFRWQEVACSEECGSTYFNLVMNNRATTSKENEVADVTPDYVETNDMSEEDIVEDYEYSEGDEFEESEEYDD